MNTLVLYADQQGTLAGQAIALNEGGVLHSSVHLDTLSAEAERTIVILDGRAASCQLVELPDFPENKLAQILPGIMESRVAASPAATHFAAMPGEGETRPVISVERSVMDRMQAELSEMGLQASVILPDYMCVPAPEEGALIHSSPTHALVRAANGEGFAAEADIVSVMAPAAENAGDLDTGQLAELAAKADATLLQGAYAAKHNFLAGLVWFKRAAGLAAATFVLWLGAALYTASSNFDQAQELYSAADAAFRQALPEVTRVVNPEVQMRQKVAEIRQRSGGAFFLLSDRLFRAVEASEQTVLEGLRFDSERDELAITLSFSSFAAGEGLKASLQQNGISVAEGSSRQDGGRVFSDLTLRRAN